MVTEYSFFAYSFTSLPSIIAFKLIWDMFSNILIFVTFLKTENKHKLCQIYIYIYIKYRPKNKY